MGIDGHEEPLTSVESCIAQNIFYSAKMFLRMIQMFTL